MTEPLMYFAGQPYSRESAAKMLAEFDADKDLVKAALAGDTDAQEFRAAFWQMSRGIQPGGEQAPIDRGLAAKQASEAAERDYEKVNPNTSSPPTAAVFQARSAGQRFPKSRKFWRGPYRKLWRDTSVSHL